MSEELQERFVELGLVPLLIRLIDRRLRYELVLFLIDNKRNRDHNNPNDERGGEGAEEENGEEPIEDADNNEDDIRRVGFDIDLHQRKWDRRGSYYKVWYRERLEKATQRDEEEGGGDIDGEGEVPLLDTDGLNRVNGMIHLLASNRAPPQPPHHHHLLSSSSSSFLSS